MTWARNDQVVIRIRALRALRRQCLRSKDVLPVELHHHVDARVVSVEESIAALEAQLE